MVVQVLLQVREDALYLVVRVGHAFAFPLLVGEQVWQVEGDAVLGCPQALVGVVRLARPLVLRLAVDRMSPVVLPLPELSRELGSLQHGETPHECFQCHGSPKSRILCQIAVDDAAHVELAHLYPALREHAEKAAHPVDDDALDGVSVAGYRVHRLHIVGNGLVPEKAT